MAAEATEQDIKDATKHFKRSLLEDPLTLETQGRLGHLDEAQQAQLEALQTHFQSCDSLTETGTLRDRLFLRYLRARKWNVEKAVKMLQKTLEWRISANVASVEERIPELINEIDAARGWLFFHNRLGMPSFVLFPGRHRKCKTEAQLLATLDLIVLFLTESERRLIEPIEQFVVVVDLVGFGMASMDYALVQKAVAIFQDHFPERLAACFIVNCPRFFFVCWKLILPWLDPVVASKTALLPKGSDQVFHRILQANFDDQYILECHGGASTFVFENRGMDELLGPRDDDAQRQATQEAADRFGL